MLVKKRFVLYEVLTAKTLTAPQPVATSRRALTLAAVGFFYFGTKERLPI
jgi:hypothetical protein